MAATVVIQTAADKRRKVHPMRTEWRSSRIWLSIVTCGIVVIPAALVTNVDRDTNGERFVKSSIGPAVGMIDLKRRMSR